MKTEKRSTRPETQKIGGEQVFGGKKRPGTAGAKDGLWIEKGEFPEA